VPISAIIQNPRQDSTLMDLAYQCWLDVGTYSDIGLINVHDEFMAQGKNLSLYLSGDTTHPSASAQLRIVFAKVWDHYQAAKPSVQQPVLSSLLPAPPERNLIPYGHFGAYATSPGLPTGWSAGGVGTLTAEKETTIIGDTRLGYSVKLTSATNASRMEHNLPAEAYTALRGQRVTVAARRYVPSGAGANVGRLQIASNSVASSNPFSTTRPYVTLQAGWVWWIISGFLVPADATSLSVRLFHDSTAGAPSATPCYWDQCCLVPGYVPRAAR
jgi:hypothetical protein